MPILEQLLGDRVESLRTGPGLVIYLAKVQGSCWRSQIACTFDRFATLLDDVPKGDAPKSVEFEMSRDSKDDDHARGPSELESEGTAETGAIADRLRADRPWLARHGIELTQWGPDPASGKVKIYLAHYDDAARQVLLHRYGTAIIVSTESRSWRFTG
jgi:hypothetical protein